MPSFVTTRQQDGVVSIHIGRPERRNGIGVVIAEELRTIAEILSSKGNQSGAPTKVITLTATPSDGHAGRTWIAGGDLKELAKLDRIADVERYSENMLTFSQTLQRLPALVLTAIEGAAIGGGAELALMGDLRLATADAEFDFRQLDVGLPTGYGGAHRLAQLLGLGHAQQIIWMRKLVNIEDAMRMGLVHGVAQDSPELHQLVQSTVADVMTWSPEVIAAQKRQLAIDLPSVDEAKKLFGACWKNPKHQATLERFLNRPKA